MKKSTAVFWGVVLIIFGALLILVQMDFIKDVNIFSWAYLWPIFMILLGVMFHVQFFSSKGRSPGLLVPGGILLVYGCLFLYMVISDRHSAGVLWPIFLVGPGFGLLELKLFSKGKEGSWIPVIILFGLAIFFFVQESFASFGMAAAVALIVIGAIIIIASVIEGNKKKDKKVEVEVDIDTDQF
jgi:hypothetical protein